jgi:hypothetical protein
LFEDRIPVHDAVRGACELLGLDPLHIANESQFLTIVAPEYAGAALAALERTPGGYQTRMIGEVREQPARSVLPRRRMAARALLTCWWAIPCRGYASHGTPRESMRTGGWSSKPPHGTESYL